MVSLFPCLFELFDVKKVRFGVMSLTVTYFFFLNECEFFLDSKVFHYFITILIGGKR